MAFGFELLRSLERKDTLPSNYLKVALLWA